MKTIDLVLVQPASRLRVYQGLGVTLAAIEPPVWASILASFVRQRGYRVAIIDAEAENLTPGLVAERVQEFNPSLIAVVAYGQQPSASTQVMPSVGAVVSAIKTLDSSQKVILIGGHVAALPERTLREEGADYVCGGEGFYTLLDLLAGLETANFNPASVRDVWYLENDQAREGPKALLVTDLNTEIASSSWDLLPMSAYRSHNWHGFGRSSRSPYVSLYTTVGCPFRCSFCCIQAPFKTGEKELGYRADKNSYRRWNPLRIVNDLEMLAVDYGIRNVKIADEMFILSRQHVAEICSLLIKKRLGLNIWAYSRVDTLDHALLPDLKAAGFNWLAFGIEAANAHVREDVQKGYRQEKIYETLRAVREAGIQVIANYIFGLPEDTFESMQETLDLAMELNCEFGNFYSTMAYPGSDLFVRASKEGWELPATWSGYSQHSVDSHPLRTKYLTSREVLRFRDEAFMKYHMSVRYLAMIERTFGALARREIEEMTRYQIVRNL